MHNVSRLSHKYTYITTQQKANDGNMKNIKYNRFDNKFCLET